MPATLRPLPPWLLSSFLELAILDSRALEIKPHTRARVPSRRRSQPQPYRQRPRSRPFFRAGFVELDERVADPPSVAPSSYCWTQERCLPRRSGNRNAPTYESQAARVAEA